MTTETRPDSDPFPPAEAVNKPGEPRSAGRRAADGSLLADRVKSLQLSPDVTAGRFRWGLLKWLVLLAIVVGGGRGRPASISAGKTGNADAKPADGKSAAGGGHAMPVDPNAGDVILESKGYVIPVHEILVSPKISGHGREARHHRRAARRAGQACSPFWRVWITRPNWSTPRLSSTAAKQTALGTAKWQSPGRNRGGRGRGAEANEQLTQLKSTFERTKRLHDLGTKVRHRQRIRNCRGRLSGDGPQGQPAHQRL